MNEPDLTVCITCTGCGAHFGSMIGELRPLAQIQDDARALGWDVDSDQAPRCDVCRGCRPKKRRTLYEWISVEDRLPPEGAEVLVWVLPGGNHSPYMSMDQMGEGGWASYWSSQVTHWQPLPEPPG